MIPLDVKKHEIRHWQIGPYEVFLPEMANDTEAEAWKAAMKSMHMGTHIFAKTFKIGSYQWMIDGNHVQLPESAGGVPLPDTEELARSVLAESQTIID